MAEVPFQKKLHPSGSLTRRILLISLCLLVVPLFLHTLFLYQQEYRKRLREVNQFLETVGSIQKESLESEIKMDWKILDAAAGYGKLGIIEIGAPSNGPARFTRLNPKTQSLEVAKTTAAGKAIAIPIPYARIIDQLVQLEKVPFSMFLALKSGDALLAGMIPMDPISYHASIQGTDLELVLSVSSHTIRGIHERGVLLRFLSLVLFIGLIGGLIVWLLIRRISRPLRALCSAMQKVSEGAVHARYTPDRMGFEINELGKQFNQTLDALLLQQQTLEKEKIARERLAQELRTGHEIQESLFPTRIPEIKELDIAAGFLPALEVGGDFYDLFFLENGSLFIAIADTAGKGVSACLYSLGLRSSLRSFAAMTHDLSEIILRANDLFWLDAQNTGMFVTLWAALYDPKTRQLTYCSQGHVPTLLVRQGAVQEMSTEGISLGAQKISAVTTATIPLKAGDFLFLYTDGVTESHNPNNQLFGKERLKQFLIRAQGSGARSAVEGLLDELKNFSRGAPQHDDVTVLALRLSEYRS